MTSFPFTRPRHVIGDFRFLNRGVVTVLWFRNGKFYSTPEGSRGNDVKFLSFHEALYIIRNQTALQEHLDAPT